MTENMGKWLSGHRKTEKSCYRLAAQNILFPLRSYGSMISAILEVIWEMSAQPCRRSPLWDILATNQKLPNGGNALTSAQTRNQQVNEGDAWVGYLDIYGFSEQVSLVGEDEIYQILLESLNIVNQICKKNDIVFVNLSDSLFFFSFKGGRNGNKYFAALIDCIAESQDELTDSNFIARGTLAHGNVIVSDKVMVGAPIVRAVRGEASLALPCVAVPLREMNSSEPRLGFSTILQLKDGGEGLYCPIFPRTLANYKNLAASRCAETLTLGPSKVAADYGRLLVLLKQYEKHNARNARPTSQR